MDPRALLISVIVLLLAVTSCRKDESILTDSSAMLEFSTDTMIFDTVFTTVGSTTKRLKVYNRNDQRLSISSIYLADGGTSAYRVNVNGEPGEVFSDVEIPAEDSIFIFIEVTIDPNDLNSPLIETDSLVFETNGNVQDVDLVAWGQDARFYYPSETDAIEGFPPLTCLSGDCGTTIDTTWTSLKPIVIYGYVIIDEDDRLTIEAGTQIYFHEGSGLWVYEGGHLEVNGTFEDPVVFQGDRLEEDFDDIPGQWDLIRIYDDPGGEDNVIRHAVIKNSIIGLEVQTIPILDSYAPLMVSANQLILENTIIQQTSSFGLFARNYRIKATNCLFANAGQSTCGLSGGGEYDFLHCSFPNYWRFGTRQTPSFYATNYFEYVGQLDGQATLFEVTSDMDLTATNCIMDGNTFEEFGYDWEDGQTMEDILFDHCILEVDETDISDPMQFMDIFSDIPFMGMGYVSTFDNDFHLLEDAYPRDLGSTAIFISADLDNETAREDSMPDIGCYEWEEE